MKILVRGAVLLGLVAALSACTQVAGKVSTRRVDTSGVRRVAFEGVGEMEIVQGAPESLTIEAQADVLERISTVVRGDTLTIRLKPGFWRAGTIPAGKITYALAVSDLESVELAGAGNVRITGLSTTRLELVLKGAGATDALDLSADELVVEHRGAGSATVSGQVVRQEVLLAGAGSYQAGDLASDEAQVEIAGTGAATVWAKGRLDARIKGVGSIRYYGEPVIQQQISGVGQIKSLGTR